ncbi:Cyclin-B1-1 [Capsicum baccatum]|uniref:Cyclin-B1-1 n=1 Tax=Capsicum baccatum TaxID=33114 RepID=A0A2G2WFV3_CAPBA|nr:Cyclin-B1-1 [Capsicum baccatum]
MYDVLVNFIKVACGLSKKSKEQIVDMDAADVNYELAILEYVEDIYSFYKLAEFCDWSTYLQLLHPSGNNSGNLCISMLHCVKLVVVDKVAMVGEVKLAMWNPHCLPISQLLRTHNMERQSALTNQLAFCNMISDELISMDSTVSGYATTSLFSKAIWVSINPLLSTGYQSPLKLDELPLLPPDFQAEFRLCSMSFMKLPKMLNLTWSMIPEMRSSLPRSRQGNMTNNNKQKLPVVLPSPASTSQVHNGSNHAKVCTQQEKLNSSL